MTQIISAEDSRCLLGAVDSWQRTKIEQLDKNTLKFPDMAWQVDGKVYHDCRNIYTCSTFMTTLFETSVGKSEDICPIIFSLNEKPHIFHMIRVFCHTGLICFAKSETILRTLERYAAFQFYGIEMGQHVLKRLILDSLTPSNAIMAFEYAVHRHDNELLCNIKEYISNYAFVVFRQKSFMGIKKESFGELINMCDSDSLNVAEIELLSHLYRLCERKTGSQDFIDFKNAFTLLTHPFGESSSSKSLFDIIRLTSISMDEFMSFVLKHPGAISNDDIVGILRKIHQPLITGRKRKKFQVVSSYPRNLNFQALSSPQVEISHCERDKVEAYFVFDFVATKSKTTTTLPSINWRNNSSVRCSIVYLERSIGLTGRLIYSSSNISEDRFRITASIINFRHDRWKKSTATINLLPTNGSEFQIPNMLSCNAIEGNCGGYVFDVNKYPEYHDTGSSLMMSLSCEKDVS